MLFISVVDACNLRRGVDKSAHNPTRRLMDLTLNIDLIQLLHLYRGESIYANLTWNDDIYIMILIELNWNEMNNIDANEYLMYLGEMR